MRSLVIAAGFVFLLWGGRTMCSAGEIGFVEDFVFAPERSVALAQLIPGTEEFYYYHALDHLAHERFEKLQDLLTPWVQRHGETARVWQIRTRLALLTYPRNPQASLEHLQRRLKLSFPHQREDPTAEPNLPTQLDQALISRKAGLERANAADPDHLNQYEDSALDWLTSSDLTPDRRRELLSRLTRPDVPGVVKLIAADLDHAKSGGFGSLGIHRFLLRTQLDELLRLKPGLLNQQAFVRTMLSKLGPTSEENGRTSPELLQAHLDRLAQFAGRLNQTHNTLKAHVAYHQLQFDLRKGQPDKARFLAYLKLPRPVPYAARKFLESEPVRKFPCRLDDNYDGLTRLAPIGNDERLVREFLLTFLREAPDTREIEPFIDDVYLRQVFAEAKITSGLGSAEQWASLLSPGQYQQLKDRIDLTFLPTNPVEFAVGQPVSLELAVKNVPTLIVRVFEINTTSYYREHGREIDTDINLDGLVPSSEQTFQYNDPSARRITRRFEFPQLNRPGVYVIDFIGNGQSSRALIRKGRLQHVVRTTANGQAFTIYDETGKPVPNASLWLGGRVYSSADNAPIVVPFSTSPGRVPVVLTSGDFSCLDFLGHEGENYTLEAGLYVDREALLTRAKATVVVRPGLFLNSAQVPIERFEKVRLTIVSTNLDGIPATQFVDDFPLFEDRETAHEIVVPTRLASIQFTLSGIVKRRSAGNAPQPLAATVSYALNGIERSDSTADLHLVRSDRGYLLELRGKMGEPRAARPVTVVLKQHDFRTPLTVALKTDPGGRIDLGPLAGIEWITATGAHGPGHTWSLDRDQFTTGTALHAQVGEAFTVPFVPGPGGKLTPSEVSLLELRGTTFVADRFENIRLQDGLLVIAGLPAGDFDLWLKTTGIRISLRVSAGQKQGAWLVGPARLLETSRLAPLQIASLEPEAGKLRIRLTNRSKFTRVHVFASRMQPEYSAFEQLARVRAPGLMAFTPSQVQTLYLTGRQIGDEYSYILNRQRGRKWPGNMLERPSLLLNPWAVQETETGEQVAVGGDEFGAAGDPAPSSAAPGDTAPVNKSSTEAFFANLDFLAEAAVVLTNLLPNEQGVLEIPLAELGSHQHLVVVAVDPLQVVARNLALPEQNLRIVDQRLGQPLDPRRHFIQQQQQTLVEGGKPFVLEDASASRFELYDSLARVYGLYRTLSQDPLLEEFAPLLTWPKMTDEEKRTFYSKHACHELNYFLFRKDPAFFEAVIRPYLAHKRHPTFLDHWLLGGDLGEWRQPWRHAQLNVVEQILLAQRIAGEGPVTARHLSDQFAQLPPNSDWQQQLFETSLQGSALSLDSDFVEFVSETGILEQRVTSDVGRESNGIVPGFDAPFAGTGGGMGGLGGGMLGAKGRFRTSGNREKQGQSEAGERPGADAAKASKKLSERLEDRSRSTRGNTQGLGRGERNAANRAADNDMSGDLNEAKSPEDTTLKFFDADASGLHEFAPRDLFRQPETTREWAENNYYHQRIAEQDADLVTINAFWRDFARHPAGTPFVSRQFAEASRNFTEMLLALSVLDLPWESPRQAPQYDGPKMTLESPVPAIAVHEEIREVEAREAASRVLVGQAWFRQGERHRIVDGEQVDLHVTDEFLVHTVYGCQVVITNPNSTRQKLTVLLQIPQGAIPVLNGRATKSVALTLEPYHTQTVEYFFYFPAAGEFAHFPVHVARNDNLLAFAAPFTFHVVDKPTKTDEESWDFLSQTGTPEAVLSYLDTHNVSALNLGKIAWRMHDAQFFEAVVARLAARHVYDHTLWSYALRHNAVGPAREYLQHCDELIEEVGGRLRSPLLIVDPLLRRSFEHLEYRPLINARAHALGKRRQIVNDRIHEQYHAWLNQAAFDAELSTDDRLTATCYLLLQDRVSEAREMFAQVIADQVTSRMQYDYCAAYLDFFNDEPTGARAIAQRYVDHPVDRWRNTFRSILAQLDEAEGKTAEVVDPRDRDQRQGALAATEPALEFRVESGELQLDYQNLKSVRIQYFLMDVELLFSRNPFVQQFRGQFSAIKPNQIQTVVLTDGTEEPLQPVSGSRKIPLPPALRNKNVLVEVLADGVSRSQAYYAHSLAVQVIENYGQVRVTQAEGGRPVPKAYVKVYAQHADGTVKFYKDGYTDLRGRFDYASLSTDDLGEVRRFSILILSDQHGALVREAAPPKQ